MSFLFTRHLDLRLKLHDTCFLFHNVILQAEMNLKTKRHEDKVIALFWQDGRLLVFIIKYKGTVTENEILFIFEGGS